MERFASPGKNPLQERVSSNPESLTRFLVPMLLNPQVSLSSTVQMFITVFAYFSVKAQTPFQLSGIPRCCKISTRSK
jgi:hypothetical protein